MVWPDQRTMHWRLLVMDNKKTAQRRPSLKLLTTQLYHIRGGWIDGTLTNR